MLPPQILGISSLEDSNLKAKGTHTSAEEYISEQYLCGGYFQVVSLGSAKFYPFLMWSTISLCVFYSYLKADQLSGWG